jgi:aryl-alcohol dehydrogenase-like predicted oxidoreductase
MLSSDIGKERVEKTKKLMSIAEKMDIPMATLAIAWCLKNPNVSTVILGASKASQLEENLIAGEKVIQLTDEIMEDIEKILENKPEPMELQFED